MSKNASLKGQPSDNVAEVDGVANALVTIDTIHNWIHEGVVYTATELDLTLAADASIELLLRVPAATYVHFGADAAVGSDASVWFFEDPTSTDDGSAVSRINRNRASANTSSLLVFTGPTLTGDGTKLSEGLIPGGSGGNANGGQAVSLMEWILNEGDYLVRLTNEDGGASADSIALHWYEPT